MDLSATIHFLGELLGQVIAEQETPGAFELEEQVRQLAKARRLGEARLDALAQLVQTLDGEQTRIIASAFSLYFDLVNLAEENQRVQILRQHELENYPEPRRDSIAEAVGQLRARGVTAEQMGQLLGRLKIELVLTAHPTEAKRRTIL